jgi:hypothetical protein
MDRFLAQKLESEDDDFSQKIVKLATDYIALGQQSLDYYGAEYDVAHDLLMCYAPLTSDDLEKLDRGHPKRFILPIASTQITTMTTFISQMLFGDVQPHKVEGRGPEDETAADHMNQLLRWGNEQQPAYLLGYLWIQDILVYNRGIRYNTWSPIFKTKVEAMEVELEEVDEAGAPVKVQRIKRTKIPVAAYNRVHLVSPYEFYCDPALPLTRFQDGRFAGHRTIVTWQELKRRSLLQEDDPAYVSPASVEKLKKKQNSKNGGLSVLGTAGGSANNSARAGNVVSRTAFDRNRGSSTGAPITNANKNDPGTVELHELSIRLVPEDNEIYEGTEPVIFQILLGNRDVVLSINESPNEHDEFPYAVAEGRPSGYYQNSPSWLMMLKPLQDYIDYLKNRRQQSISRTGGNIFIARPDSINLTDFLNPDKDGLIIPVLPDAAAQRLDDIIKQVPVVDTTKDFHEEMKDFNALSETVTGVNTQMQGQVDGSSTATEFASTQQMSAGRLTAVARLISVQGLVPETRQFVSNYQQFLSQPMSVRFVSNGADSPSTYGGQRALQISRDTIQGSFDFVAHDGSLPGTDNRKVAAISRLLELAPVVPQYFTPEPGNIDGRALILAGAKGAGLNVENFQFSQQDAQQPAAAMPPGDPSQGGALPNLDPSALPGGAPGPGAGRPRLPDMTSVPTAAPPQIRPQQL